MFCLYVIPRSCSGFRVVYVSEDNLSVFILKSRDLIFVLFRIFPGTK